MKKKRLVAIMIVFVLATALAVVPRSKTSESFAVSTRQEIIEENFNVEELSADWTTEGAVSLHNISASMRIIKPDVWQPAIMLQREDTRVTSGREISFSMHILSGVSWLGLVLGSPAPTSPFYEAKTMLMLSDTGIGVWETNGAGNIVEDKEKSIAVTPMPDAVGDTVSVKLKLTPNGEQNPSLGAAYAVELYWGAKGSETLKHIFKSQYAEDYFGFCAQAGITLDIFDFEMRDADGKTIFKDDFTASSVSYPTNANAEADWRVTHIYGPDRVYFGYQKDLLFSADKAKAVVNTQLIRDPRSERTFTLTFDFATGDAPAESVFGVGLGLRATTDKVDSVNFVGFKKVSATKVQTVVIKNGTETIPEASTRFDAGTVTLTGYYDGRLEVSSGGATRAKLDGFDFDGYVALGVVGGVSGETAVATVDNLSLHAFVYRVADTADSGQNFGGVREFTQFGETFYEHYINTKRWLYMGTGVSFPQQYTRRYMNFSDASGNVAFGLKERYSEFILRFSVVNTTLKDSKKKTAPIGVSIGRRYIDSTITESAAILFNDNSGNMTVSALNAAGATVEAPLNFYRDNETTYNVMVIVAGGTATVFVKDAAEAGDFAAPIAVFEGIDSYGYVAVTCDSRDGRVGNFRLSDFSVVNIAPSL